MSRSIRADLPPQRAIRKPGHVGALVCHSTTAFLKWPGTEAEKQIKDSQRNHRAATDSCSSKGFVSNRVTAFLARVAPGGQMTKFSRPHRQLAKGPMCP